MQQSYPHAEIWVNLSMHSFGCGNLHWWRMLEMRSLQRLKQYHATYCRLVEAASGRCRLVRPPHELWEWLWERGEGPSFFSKVSWRPVRSFYALSNQFLLRARLSKNLTLVHPFPSVEGNMCMNGHFVTLKSFFAAIIFSNFWDINKWNDCQASRAARSPPSNAASIASVKVPWIWSRSSPSLVLQDANTTLAALRIGSGTTTNMSNI